MYDSEGQTDTSVRLIVTHLSSEKEKGMISEKHDACDVFMLAHLHFHECPRREVKSDASS